LRSGEASTIGPAEAILREIVLPSPPDEVWEALTNSDQLSAWFGGPVELESRRGGSVRFTSADGTERRGVVEAFEPERSLAFRWRAIRADAGALDIGPGSRVEFDLEPVSEGTRLRVLESGLSR
jgi:uncharacterized protein YndB with AHSA1/START domain